MKSLELDVVATRGTDIESRHRVHAAVVGPDDSLIAGAHDWRLVSSWRSCGKPFQVMPLLESGGFDELRWGDDELALACASHGGEPEHVALAGRMLNDIGLEEGDLACGPHDPLSSRGMKLLRESGARLTRLHNNCSGKHAAMLARAHTAGWHTYGYERREHPVQRCCLQVRRRVVRARRGATSGRRSTDAASSHSRCRWRTWRAPGRVSLARCATAMRCRRGSFTRCARARFSSAAPIGSTPCSSRRRTAASIAKVGAEGVHSVGIPEQGIGFAVKVDDGAQRAQFPAVLRILQSLDVLPAALPPRLEEYARRPVRNTRGEVVGEVRLAS